MNFPAFVDLLKELVREPSVVGLEHSFFKILQRELEERGAKVTWYEGVLVAQGAKPDSLMFSAHVDRHGLICTGPNEYQYAAYVTGRRSDLLGNSVSEYMMNKIAGRFENRPVMAYEPWSGEYYGTGKISNTYVCEHRHNLIFEVEGLEGIVAGTPVGFADRLKVEGDFFKAQLDNVLTVACLVHLFSLGFEGTAFFTAREESGQSWRFLLEWFRRFGSETNNLIVADTSPYPDIEDLSNQSLVLRNRDANANFSESATMLLADTCDELGISYAFKDEQIETANKERVSKGKKPRSMGSTEMGRVVMASEGQVDGTTLQIPTTGYHTMSETASQASCKSFLSLALALADKSVSIS